jgi:hypothetical protein
MHEEIREGTSGTRSGYLARLIKFYGDAKVTRKWKKIYMSGMTEYIAMLDVGHVLLNIIT